jgi:hypothetical protein
MSHTVCPCHSSHVLSLLLVAEAKPVLLLIQPTDCMIVLVWQVQCHSECVFVLLLRPGQLFAEPCSPAQLLVL